MYFAQMFHFGFHNDCAGITGIKSCMGVIFVGDRPIYAIHIPYGNPTVNLLAAGHFADMIKRSEPKPSRGKLFVFTNNNERSTAAAEARHLRGMLNGPATTLYTLTRRHLESGLSSPNSAAIMVSHRINGLVAEYKHIPEPDNWKKGGKPSIGIYDRVGNAQPAPTDKNIIPKETELQGGWHRCDSRGNCTILKIQ